MSNLSDLLPAGAAAKQLTFTDSGSGIATKKPVILNSDGTVSEVSVVSTPIAVGSSVDFQGSNGDVNQVSATYDTTNDKVVVVYRDAALGYGTAVVGTVSGTSTSWGTPVVFQSAAIGNTNCCFDSGNGKVFIAYRYSNQGWAVVGTVSGTSISYGTAARFEGGGGGRANYIQTVYDSTLGVVVVGYYDSVANYSRASVNTISGTSFTTGTPVNIWSPSDIVLGAAYDSSAERVVFCYQTSGSIMRLIVGDVSGTTIAFNGSEYNTTIQTNGNAALSYDPVQNKTLLYFNDATANDGKVGSCTVTGDAITVGTLVANSGGSEGNCRAVYNAQSATHVLGWYGTAGQATDATISGTSVTLSGTITTFFSDYIGGSGPLGLTYDPDQKVSVFAFRGERPGLGTYEGDAIVYQSGYSSTNLTAQAFVGVADSAISASAAGSIIVQGGTVSGVSSGTGVSKGTAVQYSASNLADIMAADSVYDSTNNKVIVVYDGAGSGAGYGIVGTISGTSVSYGSAVQYSSGNAYFSQVTYDSTNQRVVVAYADTANSNYLTAVVGTVSGTSISWGTPVVADSTARDFYTGIDFDINAGKVLIIWKDNSTAYNYSIVGTVSGTSISFGTRVAIDTTHGYQQIGGLTYDVNAQKHLFTRPRTSGSASDAYVGTISGTSVSWGSATSISSTEYLYIFRGAYDPNAQKIAIVYRDASASDFSSQVATISGTSVSFGTRAVIDSTISPDFTGSYYDSSDQTIVAFGRATNYYGYIGTISGTSISWGAGQTLILDADFGYGLGSPSYDANADAGLILFANAGGTAAESAVTTAGDLPLTVGTKYYVTTSGGFSSSADTPSVNAGLAISTTSLLLNGDS